MIVEGANRDFPKYEALIGEKEITAFVILAIIAN
jgi:hypothetical protein